MFGGTWPIDETSTESVMDPIMFQPGLTGMVSLWIVTPLYRTVWSPLNSVSMLSETDGWMVGQYGKILHYGIIGTATSTVTGGSRR